MNAAVGKHINNITLNPLEYLLDDKGGLMVFDSKEQAKDHFESKGVSEEEMYWMVFEEVEA